MFFKKRKEQAPPQVCQHNAGTDECDVVSQIRLEQAELKTLQEEVKQLTTFEDFDARAIFAIINSANFRFLFPPGGYRLYRHQGEFFEGIYHAMIETNVDRQTILDELEGLFDRMDEIRSKQRKIIELKQSIQEKKQLLGIQ